MVSFDLFRKTSLPYLEVRRPFILGTAEKRWRATLSHFFIQLLHDKNLLTRLYTQNIDGLDYQTDLPQSKIIPVHGSIGLVECEACGHPSDVDAFRSRVRAQIKDIYGIDTTAPESSSPIKCDNCGRFAVKPATVLFGRPLPKPFFENLGPDTKDADLCLVIGTSLQVYPAATLPSMLQAGCPVVVINPEPVAFESPTLEDGGRIWLKGTSDEQLLGLSRELGWLDDLCAFKDRFCPESQMMLDAARQS